MTSSTLGTVGRVVYGLPFLVFGLMHFMSASELAGFIPGFLPAPLFGVYASGVLLVAAAIVILWGKLAWYGALALVVFLALTILLIHLPHLGNPQLQQSAMTSLFKDLALLGAALMLAGQSQPKRG